ncbi:kinase-like protein [Heliocybe sulcata]|uniref:Kinase-like protein n=1 Tax=Heliocybe sulcata TaxID=5364 RepID=A0A5C3N6R4_9AGAM|nr:kinase-like protein [Heliocybe sulcata]
MADLLTPESIEHYSLDKNLWPTLMERLQTEDNGTKYLEYLYDYIKKELASDLRLRAAALVLMKEVGQHFDIYPPQIMIQGADIDPNPCGDGGFAVVYKGLYQGKAVAGKRPKADGPTFAEPHRMAKMFRREVAIWCLLEHPYIQPFIGAYALDGTPAVYAVSPWCERGTIKASEHVKTLSQTHVNRWIFEIAQGLKYLHSCGIIHGDLRGDNILISDDGKVQIADFGLVTYSEAVLGTTSKELQAAGARPWMAPEILDELDIDLRRTESSDIYAFACTIWELYMKGAQPWPGVFYPLPYKEVMNGNRPLRPSAMPDGLWDIVQKCWDQDPAARPHIDDVIISLDAAHIN